MLKPQFFVDNKNPNVLCLGAHSDDIEIGCGGTILRLRTEVPKARFYWVVFSGNGNRAEEALQSANTILAETESKRIDVQSFRESYFPFVGGEIKDHFEKIKREFIPDMVFTHYADDAHQDHRLISNLTWNTFRDNFILEYEIPKYDGDLKTPNLYIHLDEHVVRNKIALISNFFKTQKEKLWFSEETFKSIMRIRGIESNSPSGYAEAFHCRKIVV
jgi:LmbE family N-acetylglucosaminyl deacetylase